MLTRSSPLRRSPLARKGKRLKREFSAADQAWARAVRERDGHICQRCGGRGGQAHHVATRARRPDLRLDLANGKTLCRDCHRWCHEHPIEATALGLLSDEKYEARDL